MTPITLGCPTCGKRFRARQESAGKRVRCPYCQAAVPVPTEEDAENAGAPTDVVPAPPEPLLDFNRSAPSLELPPPPPPRRPAPAPVAPAQDWMTDAAPVPGSAALSSPPRRRAPAPLAVEPAPYVPPRTPHASDPGRKEDLASRPSNREMAAPYLRRAKGGLGWVLVGLVFLALPGFVEFAKLAYVRGVSPLPVGEGWVSIPGYVNSPEAGAVTLSKPQELDILCFGGPILLGGFFIIVGRLICGAAPSWTGGKGLFISSALFTLLGLAGLGLLAVGSHRPDLKRLANFARPGVQAVLVMAELWFILGLTAMGAALKRPKVCRAVGGYVFIAGLGYFAYTGGWELYVAYGRSKDPDADTLLLEALAWMLGWVVVIGSVWRAVAAGRSALREWLAEVGS